MTSSHSKPDPVDSLEKAIKIALCCAVMHASKGNTIKMNACLSIARLGFTTLGPMDRFLSAYEDYQK